LPVNFPIFFSAEAFGGEFSVDLCFGFGFGGLVWFRYGIEGRSQQVTRSSGGLAFWIRVLFTSQRARKASLCNLRIWEAGDLSLGLVQTADMADMGNDCRLVEGGFWLVYRGAMVRELGALEGNSASGSWGGRVVDAGKAVMAVQRLDGGL
jgi:hypothetical protein